MMAARALIVAVAIILTLLVLVMGLVSFSEYGSPVEMFWFLLFIVAWIIGARAIVRARRRRDVHS